MPNYYFQPVTVPVDIELDPNTESATITGKKGSWTFRRGAVITFRGLNTCFMVAAVHPTGLTLIDSITSVPRYHTWHKLFSGNNIFLDCANVTGWMDVK